jgi:FkbM family methyltransferase
MRLINYPVRACIRAGYRLFSELRARWPVSGTVEVTYEALKFKLHNRADDGFVQIFYYGMTYQESHVLAITSAFASKGSVILDIGANTGIDSLIVAMRNPSTTIIAIEPYSPNYDRMKTNLALNGIRNVIPRKIAVGSRRDTIDFFVPEDGRITDVSSAVEGIGEKVYGKQVRWKKAQVNQYSLDDILDELTSVGFLKCDVEGYEMEVFRGATAFFAHHLPTFIVEIVLNHDSVAFFNSFATEHSYTIYYLTKEGLIRLDELYLVDWRGDFLFSQYRHAPRFVPASQFDAFVDAAWSAAPGPMAADADRGR